MPLEQSADRSAELAEKADNSAELQFASQKDVVDYRDKLVANFDKGFAGLSGDQAFRTEFKAALDQIIKKETERFINVRNLKELVPGAVEAIKKVVEAKMQIFSSILEGQVGYIRDVSDVRDTEKFQPENFRETPKPTPELSHETHNDAKFQFTEEKETVKKEDLETTQTKSLTVNYQEKGNGRNSTMTLERNNAFYNSSAKTGKDSLAAKIRQNGDTYQLPGVNYEISDPVKFNSFIHFELHALHKDPSKINAEDAIKLAAEITKGRLRIPTEDKVLKDMPSDKIPIDKLIMEGGEGACRHFSAATKVIFEEIQKITAEKGNHQLEDIVPFENHMPYLRHGTLALARGNEVTTIDPFWYAGETSTSKDNPLEATFDGKHGNVSSLYLTLSKTPAGKPENRIFDMGSSEKMVRQSQHDLGDELSATVDNNNQRILLRAYEVMNNPELQSADQLLGTAKTLEIITSEILRNPDRVENKVALDGLKELSQNLLTLIDKKIADNAQGKDDLIYSKYLLQIYVLGRFDKGSPPLAAQWEDRVAKSELSGESKEKLLVLTGQKLFELAKNKFTVALNNGESIAKEKQELRKVMYKDTNKNDEINLGSDFETDYIQPCLASLKEFTDFTKKYALQSNSEISTAMSSLKERIVAVTPQLISTTIKSLVENVTSLLTF